MNEPLLSPDSLRQSQEVGRSVVEEVGRVFIGNPALVEASVELLVSAFTNSERYGAKRLREIGRAHV